MLVKYLPYFFSSFLDFILFLLLLFYTKNSKIQRRFLQLFWIVFKHILLWFLLYQLSLAGPPHLGHRGIILNWCLPLTYLRNSFPQILLRWPKSSKIAFSSVLVPQAKEKSRYPQILQGISALLYLLELDKFKYMEVYLLCFRRKNFRKYVNISPVIFGCSFS